MSVVYEANQDNAGAIDAEWRKAMEQLRQEEEAQMKDGTYGKAQGCCEVVCYWREITYLVLYLFFLIIRLRF